MNVKCQETRPSENLLSAPSLPPPCPGTLSSSKSAFKHHLLLRSKDAGPGGRSLDSSYRSAFDTLCDLEQVTALLWGSSFSVSTVSVSTFRAQFKTRGLDGPDQPVGRAGAQDGSRL